MSLVVQSEPLGNLADFAVGARTLERIHVRSDDLAKRLLRLRASIGEIGLRLGAQRHLRDGDVLYADDRLVVAVTVDADDVLVLRPTSVAAAIGIAHALGNRHLPIHIEADTIVVRYDPLLEALAAEHGVAISREGRVVAQAFRHAHAPHRHD